MDKELQQKITEFKEMETYLGYEDGLHNVEKAIQIIEQLEKELQQSNVSNVYWELCYNKEKKAYEELKLKLAQFSEKNYKQNQKGYYGCNCYSEIDGILGEESK